MQSKDVLRTLREQRKMTQEQLAEQVLVTRQAVSRWENGETVPNVETLKLLSRLFNVSINTLLGAPRTLVCQCCGMPLTEDAHISREPDGSFNEEYCQWCYRDGQFVYSSMDSLMDYLVTSFSGPHWPEEAARAYYRDALPRLKHWSRPGEAGGE